MRTIQGYYDGEKYVALESANIQVNQRVQITILDEYIQQDDHTKNSQLLAHYKGLGGKTWEEDPQEYVSRLRSEERL